MIAIAHKTREYLSYLLAVYFIFPTLWGSFIVGLWGLSCLVCAIGEYKSLLKRDWLNAGFYSLPFLLIFLSTWLHPGNGNAILERSMSFAIFPICIFLSQLKLDKKKLTHLLGAFLVGCVLLAVKGGLLYIFVTSNYQYDEQHDFIFRYRQEFNTNTGIAPTYAAMYFAFAIIAIVLLRKEMTGRSIWVVLLGVFLFANMLLLSAKMPLLALAFILMILYLKKDIGGERKLRRRGILVILLAGLLISTLFIFTRWKELFTAFHYTSVDVQENSVGIRGGITHCGIELSKKYFLWGVGPQNVQQELNYCYYQFEGNDFERHTFNTHNQYLDFVVSSGFMGLLVLLLVFIVPIKRSLTLRDPLLFSFFVLVALCMITENILSRHSGVIFYCFFAALLLNKNQEFSSNSSPATLRNGM